MDMHHALTRAQARRIDELATSHFAMPGLILMENAAINASSAILDFIEHEVELRPELARVVVLCGTGHNGGDGYAIARHLHNWGAFVALFSPVDPNTLAGDTGVQATICRRMGLLVHHVHDDATLERAMHEWDDAHLLVDALLGTGFEGGAVRPGVARMIRGVNRLKRPPVIAIDTPSGLNVDTGEPSDPTVRADLTVTFVAPKVGFDRPAALDVLGRVVVADIGVPRDVVEEARRGEPV